jgi:hypothetical protein
VSEEEHLIQVVYASRAAVPCDGPFLGALLEKARKRNGQLGVSGVLLYQTGAFLQVLEGAPDVVTALYEKIQRDLRHDRVVILKRGAVAERSFSEWSMGLMKTDSKALKGVPGLNEFLMVGVLNLAEDSERLSKILDGFRRGLWRQNIVS